MKVNELVGYKSKPEYQAVKSTSYVGELQKKLRDLGYKKYELGSGIFAVAYARPEDDFIIKVFSTDEGYQKYLEFIKANASPYVPKLKGKSIRLPNDYTIVRVEKLTEISLDTYMDINHFLYSTSPMLRKVSTYELDKKFPGLTDLLLKLKENAEAQGVKIDLHSGNVMMRGNTPVITDPYIKSAQR